MLLKDVKEYCLSENIKLGTLDLKRITSRRLDLYLKEEKYWSNEQLVNFWEKYAGVHQERINFFDFNKKTISTVSWDLINHLQIIPFDENGKVVKLLVSDPYKMTPITILEQLYEKRSELYFASKEEITELINLIAIDSNDKKQKDYDKVVKLLDSLIKTANNYHVSDIHFKINKRNVDVSFRIDGVLKELLSIDLNSYHQLLTKIKLLASLDITISMQPQDGHFVYQKHNYKSDIRVSTIPTIDGERLVLRIFNIEQEIEQLEDLGFNDEQLSDIKKSLSGGGIIFVTGPTGSGKTTTLYAFIDYLKRSNLNIMSVEDPVERRIDEITQIPLQLLDYPTILKSIMRQDPDVIMLGEIRDTETAKLAVRLAQTGHLILTTIHTPDSISVITRLENMGIPKYLIVDAIKLVISQRLLRKPCPVCHYEERDSCPNCHSEGYVGRIMVSEVIRFDNVIKNDIMKPMYKQLIFEYKKGSFLKDQALKMIQAKQITLEEVNRSGIEL